MTVETRDFGGKSINFARFDSMSDLAAYVRSQKPGDAYRGDDNGSGSNPFYGASLADALQMCETGAPDLVPQSDEMLRRLEARHDFSTSKFVNVRSVTGGAPNVPAYLANQPMAMRRRKRVQSDMAPLSIYVNVGANSDVRKSTIRRRGAAVLALVRALCGVRPVSLYVMSGHSDGDRHALTVARVETAPLDLARAAFALAHPAMLRRLMFSRNYEITRDDCFVPLFDNTAGRADVAAALMGEEEFIFSARLSGNSEFASDDDASRWIEEQVRAATGRDVLAA